MKKIRLLLFILVLLPVIFTACGKDKKAETADKIYYLSTDKTKIVGIPYEFESITTISKIREALDCLSTEVGEVDYMMTIPHGVILDEWDVNERSLSLYFTNDYYELDACTEVLVRAAIVKTLVQIEGVDSVSIYVNNSPLTDSSGAVVGAMTAYSFIDDFGEETDSLLSTDIVLYFASADGKSLVKEERQVYYSRNVALEKLVIEQLLKGPETEKLLSAIPSDTKLLSVSLTNDTCYVNFDAAFETAITGVTENATVYSIVNSLTQLDSVQQVMLLVNGEVVKLPNVDIDLANPISANPDIINVVDDTEEEEIVYDENNDPVEVSDEVIEEESVED